MHDRYAIRKCGFTVAAVFVLLSGCGPKQSDATHSTAGVSISIKGSDTMLPLVKTWSDAFMKVHPEAKISLTGGGSGTGIAALLNGTTDICAASRDLTPEEKKTAESKGLKLDDRAVARDALSVIVNPKNPVNELTLEQIAKIYTGTFTNWQELGGPDEAIVVVSRESSSGTYIFFQEHVLNKKDFAANALLLQATSAILQTVADSSGGIGYVGLGYAQSAAGKVKTIGVKATPDAPAVKPNAENVLNGHYSISRPLFLIVSKAPEGAIKSFLDFCVSSEGQQIVEEQGYVKVK